VNARKEQGDAGCVRDYVFVDDVVRANLAAFRGEVLDPVMNVCTGEGTSTRKLAEDLQTSLSLRGELRAGPRRPGDVERSVLDPTRCLGVLKQLTSLDEGLRKTAAWFAQR
jgi:UDP-glucose 4-epimerase